MAGPLEPQTVVAQFNAHINKGDLVGPAMLMTDEHAFIDSAGTVTRGKQECLFAWLRFFRTFPDYRNVLERMVAKRAAVTATGRSICSDPRLDGPALWTAEVRYDRISEWRVYDDTASNRRLLGIS